MYLPLLIDEALDFYRSYMVEHLLFLILLAFLALIAIFVLKFLSTKKLNTEEFCLVVHVTNDFQDFEGIIKIHLKFC